MKINVLNPKIFVLYIFMFITALDGIIIPTLIAGIVNSVEIKSITSLINYFLFGVVGYCTVRTSLYLWNVYQQKFIRDFNNIYKGELIHRYYAGSNSKQQTNILSFIINDFKYLEENYIKSLFLFIYCVAFATISAIYVVIIDYKIGLLFILFSTIPVITPKLYRKKIKHSTDEWSQNSSRFLNSLKEYFSGATTIRLFNRQVFFKSILNDDLNRIENSNYIMQKTLFQSNWVTNILSGMSSFIPLFIGGYFVIEGHLSLAALMAVYLASDRIVTPAVNAINHYNKLKSSQTIIDKYNSLTKILNSNEDRLEEKIKVNDLFPIKFLNVSHRYGEQIIFDGINFKINKGEHILLKGTSGSGKSTFLKLLLLIEKPTHGNLYFNNVDANQMNFININQHIYYFEQNPFIFNDSILFNITMGESFNDKDIENVIEQCNLIDLIKTHGLEYNVGVNGEYISGGQKMRIALARIMIRKPSFVLLDEFSAGLDLENANFIREMIHENVETVIEITHDEIIDMKYYIKTLKIIDRQLLEVK